MKGIQIEIRIIGHLKWYVLERRDWITKKFIFNGIPISFFIKYSSQKLELIFLITLSTDEFLNRKL